MPNNQMIDSQFDALHNKPLKWNSVTKLWERQDENEDVDEIFTYDINGRLSTITLMSANTTKTIMYTYNIDGTIATKSEVLS